MKKITYFFVLLIAFVGFTNEIYCQATVPPCNTDGSFQGADIYDIAIFNFTTTDGVTNIDNTSTDGTETSAIDYTSQYLEVYSGAEASVPFSVLVGNSYPTSIQISLDSNQDGQFTSTEVLFDVYGIFGENTGTIAIPGTLAEGDYNLRVATVYGQTAYYDTCSLISEFGEIEDYTLRVSAPPSCLPPSGLTVASITNITATVSYTAGATETAWEYVVQPDGTGEPTGAGTASTTNTIPLTGLAGNTAYEVYVRASCGGDYSIWKKTTFTTQCSPFSTGWSNDFENTDTDNSLDCWEITNSGGSNSFLLWDLSSTLAMGIQGEATAAHDDYLASPAFTVTDGVSDRFTFDATSWDSAGLNNFDVQIWDQDNSALIATIASGVKPLVFQQFDTFFYDLSAYEGQNIRVVFYVGTTTNDAGAYLFFDNVVVDGYPNCLEVSDLTVALETTTTTTASVSWTAGETETAWEYVVQADGTGEPTGAGTATTTNPLSLTGLTSNTAYEVYVRASCGGDYSSWKKTTFNTKCDVLTAPYTQEFTTMTIIEGSEFTIENCWYASNSGVYWEAAATTDESSNNTGPGSGVSDGNYMLFEATFGQENDTAILYSPSIDLSSLTTPRLSFDYHMFGANIGSLEVSIIDSSNETLLQTITGQQQTAETEPFINLLTDLSSYSGSVYFKFTAKKGTDYRGDIAIDNFKVEETPSCLPISGLTVASITNITATVSYTAGATETAWEYVVQPDRTGEPTGAGTASTTNPIPLTGLAGNTAYEVYVRASCGFSDFSTWEKTTFTTQCDPFSAGWSNDFENTVTDNSLNCWEITNSGGPNSFSSWNLGSTQAMGILGEATAAHDDYLASPAFTVTDGVSDRFTFDATSWDSAGLNNFDVQIWDQDNSALIATIASGVKPLVFQQFDTFFYDLSAYEGQNIRVVFYVGTTTNDAGAHLFFDNVIVDAVPSCLPISDLTVALETTTTTTASVSWTAGETETAWEYVVQADGTGEPTGAGTATTTNPLSLTGLTSNTAYEVYVRASCGFSDFSTWEKTTFTTQCDPFSAGWSNDFENTVTDNSLNCWEITNSGGPNSFSLWDIGSTLAMGILGEATAAHDDYLASPAFTVTDGVSDRFTFDATSWDSAGLNNFDVQIWDQDNSALIATIASGVKPLVFQQFDTFFYDLSAYEGQNIRVVFYVGTTTNDAGAHLFFDNVIVDAVPTAWTGAVDNDFSNPSNWSSGVVPDANSDITIPSNGVINLSQNITFNSMNISAGASIISSGTMTGPVTFTRNLPSSDWYLISSPVVGQDIDAFVSASNLAVGSSGTSNLGFANYDNNTEVWSYYQSGATGTGNFIPGKGHSVKSAFSSNNISFTGTFNDADASIALANNTNGYNLIGNPYLASVSVGELLSANSALLSEQTAWLWDESVDAYVQKNLAEDLELAPGQGFFVLANTAGSFTITEAMQSHSSDTFQRPTSRPEINIVLSNGKDSRNTNVYYIDGTTTGWDNGYDSSIFAGLANEFAIYTHVITNGSGRNLGIQSLPDNNYENMVIPVGIHADSETTITISATINNLPTGMNVYLEDKQENSYTLLEAGANFTTKLESNLSGIGRFYIHTTTSTLSAGDFVLNNNLSIYSTSKENLRIIGLQDGTANLQLYNAIGKEVLRTSFIGNGVNDILLPNLETGVYILKLATEAGSTNKKLIIK